MSADNNTAPLAQDELKLLKERARRAGMKFHPSIALPKLKENYKDFMAGKALDADPSETLAPIPGKETKTQRYARKRKEASKLVRINVTCMNPAKREWEGEIITASNSAAGTHKKFVPFNTTDGYHVPYIIYMMLLQRKCQVFYTAKGPRGNKVRRGKQIKEFAIDKLDDLTGEEIEDLAKSQAMRGVYDEGQDG